MVIQKYKIDVKLDLVFRILKHYLYTLLIYVDRFILLTRIVK